MYHQFDVAVAEKFGINAAVVFNNIAFMCWHNRAVGTNYHDGNYWTYNTLKKYATLYPYLSERQISIALDKLLDGGMIVKGNYNEWKTDRTTWYALTDAGIAAYEKCISDFTSASNPNHANVPAIPDINTDINTVENNITPFGKKRFQKPTLDDIQAYCSEKNYSSSDIDPIEFYNYYESVGWMVGKKPMKSWHSSVAMWVSRNRKKQGPQQPVQKRKDDYTFGGGFY